MDKYIVVVMRQLPSNRPAISCVEKVECTFEDVEDAAFKILEDHKKDMCLRFPDFRGAGWYFYHEKESSHYTTYSSNSW